MAWGEEIDTAAAPLLKMQVDCKAVDGVRPSSEAPSKDDAATKKHRVVDPSLQTVPTVQSLCQA
jgi:hypothetical protein